MMLLSALFVVATGAISVVTWNRRGRSSRVATVELLRMLAVVFATILFWQPESAYWIPPPKSPVVLLLEDHSASMETADASMRPRSEARRSVANSQQWAQLSDRYERVSESFSLAPDDGSDIAAALESAVARHESAAAIVLVSDGDWNSGASPVEASADISTREKDAPAIFTVVVGSSDRMPDVELVSANVPSFGVEDKPVRVPYTLRNWMPTAQELVVTLSVTGREATEQRVQLPSGGRFDGVMIWESDQPGIHELAVEVEAVEGEQVTTNNRLVQPIEIRKERLRVLIVESMPRWEYRYLRNALRRDPGIEVSCLLFHPELERVGGGGDDYLKVLPEDPKELGAYDVVFLGDVGAKPGQLSGEQCRLITGLVTQQASGLILMPGIMGNHASLLETELGDLYPVELDTQRLGGEGRPLESHLVLTTEGRRSLLTELNDDLELNWQIWESLPGFYWHAAVNRVKSGSHVLAVHEKTTNQYGRVPLLVTRTAGAGKILFMGTDSAWRWRLGVEDKYHYRFWGQVIRWMAYQRNMVLGERVRLSMRPERPDPGDVVSFRATIMSEDGSPLESDSVTLQLDSPSGKRSEIRLRAVDSEWGVFTGESQVSESGDHRLTLRDSADGDPTEARLTVQGRTVETVGQPARVDVMRSIAAVGGGESFRPDQVAELVSKLNQMPISEAERRVILWWNHPLAITCLFLLLSLFWIGRKWAGEY